MFWDPCAGRNCTLRWSVSCMWSNPCWFSRLHRHFLHHSCASRRWKYQLAAVADGSIIVVSCCSCCCFVMILDTSKQNIHRFPMATIIGITMIADIDWKTEKPLFHSYIEIARFYWDSCSWKKNIQLLLLLLPSPPFFAWFCLIPLFLSYFWN